MTLRPFCGALVVLALLTLPSLASAQLTETAVVTASGSGVATVNVTAVAGSALVAMVSGKGPSNASSQTTTVSGCGVTWILAKRANTRPGVADVWKAATSGSLSGCTVTARLGTGTYTIRLTIASVSNASVMGTSASASSNRGPAQVTLTGLTSGSLVYGAGSDYSTTAARTLLPGQRLLAQTLSGGTFWSQASIGAVTVDTLVVGTSAPSVKNWNFAALEITPSAAPPACTFTVNPTNLTALAAGGSSPVTITASQSTCPWTASSGAAWLTVSPTSGTGSGTVTVTTAGNTGAARGANVTVAGVSVAVSQDGATVATLSVTCPSDQTAQSANGQPVAVSYPVATATGGVLPYIITGNPLSGSLFPVGMTMVTQSVTSSDSQTQTCTFNIAVTYTAPPPVTTSPTTIDITVTDDYIAVVDGTTITTGAKVQHFLSGVNPVTGSPVMVNDVCKPPRDQAGHVLVTASTQSSCPSGSPLFGSPLTAGSIYFSTATLYGPGGESIRSPGSNLFSVSTGGGSPTVPTETGTRGTFTNQSNTGSMSVSVPSDADILIVSVTGYPSAGASNYFSAGTMTIGGQAMTAIAADGDTSAFMGTLFYQLNPPLGQQAIAWDWAGSNTVTDGGIVSYTFWKNVASVRGGSGAQQGPVATHTSGTVTAVPGDVIVAWGFSFVSADRIFTWTSPTTTNLVDVILFDQGDASWATATPTGNQAMTFTNAESQDGGCVAVVLTPPAQ